VLVLDVLRDVPDHAGSLTVFDLLKAQRGWGRQRTLRTLRTAGIPEGKRLADLTPRQRTILPMHF
jgi:hypothetical protein